MTQRKAGKYNCDAMVGGSEGVVVEGGGIGAGQAETLAVAVDEAIEVDAFAAAGTG